MVTARMLETHSNETVSDASVRSCTPDHILISSSTEFMELMRLLLSVTI